MDTMECILTRRSIRRFTAREVPKELVLELLEAVRWAPSWANTQTWEVVVVKDPVSRQQLAKFVGNNPASKGVIEAPMAMVFCSRRGVSGAKNGVYSTVKGDWSMFDCALACQNFCLAAHNRGLGTVYIGRFEHQEVDRLLGLPEGIESVVIIPLGYAAQEARPSSRKELHEFVHAEKYGQSYL